MSRDFPPKKRVFFATCNRSVSILDSIRHDLHTDIVGVLVCEKADYPQWRGDKTGLETWGWDELANRRLSAVKTNLRSYESVLKEILSDQRTFYLFERHYGVGFRSSIFNRTTMAEVLVWNSITLLMRTNPDIVFLTAPAHNPISWIFAKTAEICGVCVLSLRISPLHQRRFLAMGVDEQRPVALDPVKNKIPSSEALEVVRASERDYRQAIPYYAKGQLDLKVSYWREIAAMQIKSPKSILGNLRDINNKIQLYKNYQNLSKHVQLNRPYYIFFLHYQPEETTLPSGLGYAQQWIAISQLRMVLPKEVTLLVKEHPSMFERMPRHNFRDTYFYESISNLDNTLLVDINQDSFQLIDRSIAVATITGTAGFQAMIRGKPVIVFGAAAYRDFPTVLKVTSISELQEAVELISKNISKLDNILLERYLAWLEEISFGVENAPEKIWFTREYANTCLKLCLTKMSSRNWTFDLVEFSP